MDGNTLSESKIKRYFLLADVKQSDGASFRCSRVNCADSSQSFSIFVPNDYELINQTTPSHKSRFRQLALFQSSGSGEITVGVSELVKDVSPLEWFCGEAVDRSSKILIRKDLRTPGGIETDALVQYPNSVFGRAIVFKDGSNLFCIECKLPIDLMERDPMLPFTVCHSFELANPTKAPFAESIQTSENQFCNFNFLESWKLDQNDEGTKLTSLSSNGELYVNADFAQESARAFAKLCFERRISRTKSKHLHLIPTESATEFEHCHFGLAKFGDPQIAVVLTSFLYKEVQSCLILKTPSFKSDSKAWAINKRAYEIVRDSIRF